MIPKWARRRSAARIATMAAGILVVGGVTGTPQSDDRASFSAHHDCCAPHAANCWTGLPTAAQMEALDATVAEPFGTEAFAQARWAATATNTTTGAEGDPITLTVAFVADGTPIQAFVDPSACGPPPASSPSNLLASMDALYAASGGRAGWEPLVQEALAGWNVASGARLVFVGYDDGAPIVNVCGVHNPGILGVRADVRIGGVNIDGAPPGANVLARTYYPGHGDVVVDTANAVAGDPPANPASFRNLISHEIGHALGLRHVCPTNNTKLMEPVLGVGFIGPQSDDKIGAQSLYGDRAEPNGSALAATPIPVDSFGSTLVENLGLRAGTAADEDWFKVTIAASSDLSFTIVPTGGAILQAFATNLPQDVCPTFPPLSAPSYNPTTIVDLAVEAFDASGTPLAPSAEGATNGVGQQESLIVRSLVVPAGGTKDIYFRVYAQSPGVVPTPPALAKVQLYAFEVVAQPVGAPGALLVDAGVVPTGCSGGAGSFNTIQEAIDCAAPFGSVIVVRPGNYEAFDTLGKSVTIVASSSEVTATTILIPSSNYVGVVMVGASVLSGFTLRADAPLTETLLTAGGSPLISRCYFDLQAWCARGVVGGAPRLEDCALTSCGYSPIVDCDAATLRGCTVYSLLPAQLNGVASVDNSIIWDAFFDTAAPGASPLTPPSAGGATTITNSIVAAPAAAISGSPDLTANTNLDPLIAFATGETFPVGSPVFSLPPPISLAQLGPSAISTAIDKAASRPVDTTRDLLGRQRNVRRRDIGAVELQDQIVVVGPGGAGSGSTPWPGTGDGLTAVALVDGLQRLPPERQQAAAGSWMNFQIRSEANLYVNQPLYVAVESYPTNSPTASVFPFLHVDLVACPQCLLPFGVLPVDGVILNVPYFGGAFGYTFRAQAFVTSPFAANGLFAATDAFACDLL